MKNPFRDLRTNPFNLTDAQKYYPFNSKEEHDAALDDTLDIITPLFGGAGKAGVKAIAAVRGVYEASNIVGNMKDAVLKWLGKIFGVVINSIDKEEILHAGGKAAAREFAKKIKQRYGIDCPITDFYSDILAEELGDWIAELINDKISAAMGKPVTLFSPLFPPTKVKTDIDAFLVSEINTRLNLNITSVLSGNNAQLVDQIKTSVIDNISREYVDIITRVKGEVMAEINNRAIGQGYTYNDKIEQMQAVSQSILLLMQRFSLNKVFGFNINAVSYYVGNREKIANKMRQRKYRQSHHEQRTWVHN